MTPVEQTSAQLVARLERLPFSKWHRHFFILAFCGIAFDAADFALFGAALPPVAREFGLGTAQSGLLATVGIGYSACGFLIDKYGRRPVLFLYYFIGAFCHLWFAMASGVWLYFAAAAVGWVNPGVYGSTAIYVSELHPTHVRATAVGWFFGIGRIGSFLAPAVVGFMLAYGAGAYVLHTFALSFLIAAFALWAIGIETRGKVLEEITQPKLA
jgi:MFS transporter, putative metabolite:H+ symporter